MPGQPPLCRVRSSLWGEQGNPVAVTSEARALAQDSYDQKLTKIKAPEVQLSRPSGQTHGACLGKDSPTQPIVSPRLPLA